MNVANLDDLTTAFRDSFRPIYEDAESKFNASSVKTYGDARQSPETVKARLRQSLPEIGIFTFENGSLNRFGFAQSSDQTFISAIQFGTNPARLEEFSEPAVGAPVRVPQVVALFRPGDHIYGHWLVDILPRAWLFKVTCPEIAVKFAIRRGSPSYAYGLLRSIGITEEELIEIDTNSAHLVAEELFVVTNLRYNQCFHPAIQDFGNAVRRAQGCSATDSSAGKLFVSRRNWKARKAEKRQLLNQDAVENAYADAGYDIVFPEKLSFSDQVRLFGAATRIAGIDGSGLHNTLFSPPGSQVDILQGPANASLIQLGLCLACDQNGSLIYGTTREKTSTRESAFEVDVSLIETALRDVKQ